MARLTGFKPGALTVTARVGRKVVAIGRVNIGPGGTATARVRFTRSARRSLGQAPLGEAGAQGRIARDDADGEALMRLATIMLAGGALMLSAPPGHAAGMTHFKVTEATHSSSASYSSPEGSGRAAMRWRLAAPTSTAPNRLVVSAPGLAISGYGRVNVAGQVSSEAATDRGRCSLAGQTGSRLYGSDVPVPISLNLSAHPAGGLQVALDARYAHLQIRPLRVRMRPAGHRAGQPEGHARDAYPGARAQAAQGRADLQRLRRRALRQLSLVDAHRARKDGRTRRALNRPVPPAAGPSAILPAVPRRETEEAVARAAPIEAALAATGARDVAARGPAAQLGGLRLRRSGRRRAAPRGHRAAAGARAAGSRRRRTATA